MPPLNNALGEIAQMPKGIYHQNRLTAINANKSTYNGKPCNHCGTIERFVCDSKCVKCNRERQRTDEAKEYQRRRQQTDDYKAWDKTRRATLKYKAHKRDYDLKRKFGISSDQHKRLLMNQDWTCSICNADLDTTSPIDHDHMSGGVRGVLCRECNLMLGLVRDNTTTLRNAITYLETS